MTKIMLLCIVFLYVGCASEKYYYKNNSKTKLTSVENTLRTMSVEDKSDIDYYTTEKGEKVGVTKRILIKFIDNTNLDNYVEEYDLSIVKKISENLYLLEVEDNDLTISIANSLYEKDDVKYAHPDFVRKLIRK